MSDFDKFDRPGLPPELAEVADLLQEQAGSAPPLSKDPVVGMLAITVGGLIKDFLYQLENGEFDQLRLRMETAADWLKDLPLPLDEVG